MSDENRRSFLVNYIVDKLTAFLVEDRGLSLEHALDIIYSSKTYELLQDEKADLTTDSPSYVYELLKAEIKA